MDVVTDLNMVGPIINDSGHYMVIAIDDQANIPQHPNVYNYSMLIPPTQLLMKWSDIPDKFMASQIMNNEYRQYLDMNDCDELIVTLLAGLCKRNILIYIPESMMDVFGMIFIDHLFCKYGVRCGINGNRGFMVDINKIPFILSKFYILDYIDANTYLELYPNTLLLPNWVINKLAADLRPSRLMVDFEWYVSYFNDLNSKTYPSKPMAEMASIVKR